MLNPLKQAAALIALFTYSLLSHAAIPISVTLQPGTPTDLPSNGVASASYLVGLNQAVPGSLNLSVIKGLPHGVTQNVSGPSVCTGASVVCQKNFGLAPGGACCLKLSLDASLMTKTALISPLVATTPAAYQGQGTPLAIKLTAAESFSILSSAGIGGVIAPSGSTTSAYGTSETFTATPSTGYAIYQWLLDSAVVQTGGTTYTLTNITANHTVEVTFNSTQTTLTATPSVTLSVTGLTTTSGSNSGTPRVITITNTGPNAASNVNYSVSPALPSGSSILPASCGTIGVGDTCTLTITPDATPSAPVGNNSPTPITMTISGDNTNTPTSTVNILTYGSFYEAGWVFSIIETANTSPSIGGTVAGETDAASQFVAQYSLNGDNTNSSMYSGTEGSSNTTAMVSAYGTNKNYSAGYCISENYRAGGYTDWYLPAICQMGYGGSDDNFDCSTPTSTDYIPNMQVNLLTNNPSQKFGLTNNGLYWSSTASESDAPTYAWHQEFVVFGSGGSQLNVPVGFTFGVRCVRAIT